MAAGRDNDRMEKRESSRNRLHSKKPNERGDHGRLSVDVAVSIAAAAAAVVASMINAAFTHFKDDAVERQSGRTSPGTE